MTTGDFKKWCSDNNYTQKKLAETLNISQQTISSYCKNNSFPFVFDLALVALERNYKLENIVKGGVL